MAKATITEQLKPSQSLITVFYNRFLNKVLLAGIQFPVRADPNGSLLLSEEQAGAALDLVWLQVIVGVRPVREQRCVREHGNGQTDGFVN